MIRTCVSILVLLALGLPVGLHARQQDANLSAQRTLRIGSADDSEYALTLVAALAIGPQGHIYVSQPQDNLIRVFDENGRFVRTIGRSGQGPGEFEYLAGIGFLADTLYATDLRLRRVSFFTADGRFLTAAPLASPPVGPYFAPGVPSRLLADGTAIAIPTFPSAAGASGDITRVPYYRIDRSGRILDTLVWREHRNSQLAFRSDGAQMFTSQPFADDPLVAIAANGGVAVIHREAARSNRGQFRVLRIGTGGDTVQSRAYSYTPIPLPRGLADSVVDARVRSLLEGPRPFFPSRREAEQAVGEALYMPRFLIPVTSAHLSNDGTLWLRREDIRGRNGRIWEVHNPDGSRRATVLLPESVSLRSVERNAAWGVELDAFDVPYVVRYQLRPTGR